MGRRTVAIVAALAGSAMAESRPSSEPISVAVARAMLPIAPSGCDDVTCLVGAAYAGDRTARGVATALYRDLGHVAGVGADEHMDGGYRGTIHLVPALPIGRDRTQLVRVDRALRDIDRFFARLFRGPGNRAANYRWRDLELRFVRSVGKRTPSAYAIGWSVTYNVQGSLLGTDAGALETLFHEVFHLNDFAHGRWSERALRADYDAIVARCGTRSRCLQPYAPNTTKVRATGTYYAFQPDNGDAVHEYAAELAVRYFREQSQMLARGQLARPAFKCAAPENARAWAALVDEFFAGVDLVPDC